MQIATPGFYDISEAEYHADPCVEPSASASLLTTVVDKTLADAWWKHPRYNTELEADDETAYDLGNTAHALVLGAGRDIVPINANDWRTNAAKDARDQALADGKQPCLVRIYDQAGAMHDALLAQLGGSENSVAFGDEGFAEQAAIWQHTSEFGPLWCRALLDWRHKSEGLIYDYKTFKPGADPAGFGKYLFRERRAIQDPFYSMGVGALTGVNWITDVTYRYVVQSTDAPYVASVVQLDDEGRELAWRQATWALDQWAAAVNIGRWRGYLPRTHYVSAPPWEIADWDSRMRAEEHAAALDRRAQADA